MKKPKKNGVHPLVAVGLLVLGGGVAAKTFLDSSGSNVAIPIGEVEIVEDPGMDGGGGGSEQESEAILWSDLLAEHGSFDGRETVRLAFSVLEEARAAMPSPGGETAGSLTYWEGPDPPELQLGVVMISERARRAVLDGRVVGVKDEVAGLVVQTISRDRVVTLWGSKLLTYDLENGWPREFRAELERRKLEAQSEGENGSAEGQAVQGAGSQEIQK